MKRPPLPSPLLELRSWGAVTLIGNSSVQTAASWIGKVRRTRRIKLDGFSDPFTIADCHTVTRDLIGVDRLAVMLGSAVAEAFDSLVALPSGPTPHRAERLELLVVPAWLAPEECTRLNAMFDDWLAPYSDWCASERQRIIVRGNGTGAWDALEHAFNALAGQPQLQEIVIAAADSACEPALLQQAAEAGWLLQDGNPEGCIPGEAAACVHLRRVRQITDVRPDGFALHRPALARATTRPWPGNDRPDAAPLAKVLSSALRCAGMSLEHISHLVSDMDGSEWRAKLELHALEHVQLHQANASKHWRPANLLGHPGSAAGLIAWLLPALLHARHIECVNTVLNWSIDPSGDVAACVLERSPY